MDVESRETLLQTVAAAKSSLEEVISNALDRLEQTTLPAATQAGKALIGEAREAIAKEVAPVLAQVSDLNAKFDRLLAVVETLKASIAINIGKTQ